MEFMSNISGINNAKPSLFELLSETQLRELLEPSLRYLLALATHRNPRYLIRILNRFDEIYAIAMILVERHYLKCRGGSFSENFYGLKRERVIATEVPRARKVVPELVAETTKLRKADIWKSLFVVVGVPYLKRRLDDSYEHFSGGMAENILGASYRRDFLGANASPRERLIYYLKFILRKVYPTINAVYYFAMLSFNLAYLFDKSKYHTPFDYLIGIQMRRLTEADHRNARAKPSPIRRGRSSNNPPFTTASLLSPTILTRIILPKLLDSLKILLPTSIFFLKFLEWWHASDFARQLSSKTAASIEFPPPVSIKPPPPLPDGEEIDRKREELETIRKSLVKLPSSSDSGLCSICKRDVTNPAATQTGYVFCYPCVFRWVEHGEVENDNVGADENRKGRCPITGVRLLGGSEGLRRLMI